MITQAILKSLLHYSPATGEFTWLVARGMQKPGKKAGFVDQDGYVKIRIFKRNYSAGPLAYLYMMGEWPAVQVDHKNRKGCDDRWENIRPATSSQNIANTSLHRDSRTGFKGVTKRGRYNKWRARIVVRGREMHLGMFDSAEAASKAYITAAQKYFGEFAHA